MDIVELKDIQLREGRNLAQEYVVYTIGIRNGGPRYTVRKVDGLYIILDRLGGTIGKKESEEEARDFAYKRALGFLDVLMRTYKGEEKPKIIDEIQLRKEGKLEALVE